MEAPVQVLEGRKLVLQCEISLMKHNSMQFELVIFENDMLAYSPYYISWHSFLRCPCFKCFNSFILDICMFTYMSKPFIKGTF